MRTICLALLALATALLLAACEPHNTPTPASVVQVIATPTPGATETPAPTVAVQAVTATRRPTATPTVATATPQPTPTATRPPATATPDAEAEAVAIYAAVLRDLCTRWSPPGSASLDGIHLFSRTYDRPIEELGAYVYRGGPPGNDLVPPPTDQVLLPETVQSGISSALSDLGRLVWIDPCEGLPIDETTGELKDGGGLVWLSNVGPQKDGTVLVLVGVYAGRLAGQGWIYVLQEENGIWTVTEEPYMHWIS